MPREQGKPITAAMRKPMPASRATYSLSPRARPAEISGTRLVLMAMARAVGTLISVSTGPEYAP